MSSETPDEIIETLYGFLGRFPKAAGNLGPDTKLADDLSLDSVNLMELLVEIEDHYDVGLPLNMDGSEGPMAAMIRAVVARLESRLPAIEFSVRDERLTSWSAEQEEFAKGRKPWKDKGKIDTRAAMLLLEDYLAAEDPSRALLPEDAPPPPSLLKPGRQKPGRDRSRGRGRGSRKGGRGRR